MSEGHSRRNAVVDSHALAHLRIFFASDVLRPADSGFDVDSVAVVLEMKYSRTS